LDGGEAGGPRRRGVVIVLWLWANWMVLMSQCPDENLMSSLTSWTWGTVLVL